MHSLNGLFIEILFLSIFILDSTINENKKACCDECYNTNFHFKPNDKMFIAEGRTLSPSIFLHWTAPIDMIHNPL